MSAENTSVKCPNCKETFKVDDSVYTDIVKQVRDQQFDDELTQRLNQAVKEKNAAIALTKAETENVSKDVIANLNEKLIKLEAENKQVLTSELYKKDNEIAQKEAQLKALEDRAEFATNKAIAEIEKERDALKSALQLQKAEEKLHISKALKEVEQERDKLLNDLSTKDIEIQLQQRTQEQQHSIALEAKEQALRIQEDEIKRLKDFKQKLSTKMIGETLEQHCETSFNQIRATAFPNAYFEKDNDASGGTKGDFIYREHDDEGNEIMSIMFEMKNENDQTASKKRNEDFFAKLDKDRRDKNCEYAILVSLLESDSTLYNNGIVDVSYRYEKMYVIRPQFFIPIITVLRNAALNTLEYKSEVARIRNQNIDVTHFEEKLQDFVDGIKDKTKLASNKFTTAMDEIDKSINHLQKTKEALRLTIKHLNVASSKSDNLTIKKLTYNNPTMKSKFDKLK